MFLRMYLKSNCDQIKYCLLYSIDTIVTNSYIRSNQIFPCSCISGASSTFSIKLNLVTSDYHLIILRHNSEKKFHQEVNMKPIFIFTITVALLVSIRFYKIMSVLIWYILICAWVFNDSLIIIFISFFLNYSTCMFNVKNMCVVCK